MKLMVATGIFVNYSPINAKGLFQQLGYHWNPRLPFTNTKQTKKIKAAFILAEKKIKTILQK